MQPDAFRASLLGRECFVGLDLSDKIDLSSAVAIFPRALDREPAVVGAVGEPQRSNNGEIRASGVDNAVSEQEDAMPAGPGKPGMALDLPTITCAIDVLPFFWMPQKTLHRRAQEDKIPYPDWERDGYLTTWPGSLIDHDAIAEFVIGVLAKEFRLRGVGIDQAGAAGVVNKLRRTFGDELVDEVPQGFRSLSEASKLVEALVLTGNLRHDGNPCMAMCIANMGKEENTWREIRPVKLGQRTRMDGGVALIDAVWKMTKTPAAERSVYLTRGVRQLGA